MIRQTVVVIGCIFSMCWMGCTRSSSQTTIVATPSEAAPSAENVEDTAPNPSDSASRSAIDELVQRDAAQAKSILETQLTSNDNDISAWAAVYIRLLHVDADPTLVEQRLVRGTQSNHVLLRTLCWRWLSISPPQTLPAVQSNDDPVLKLFAAVAYRKQQKRSSSLEQAFALGAAVTEEPEKISLNTLLQRAAPFDNGPLAVAIAFVSARRMELAHRVKGVIVPVSAGYRQELLKMLAGEAFTKNEDGADPFTFEGTVLHKQIEGAMEGQPLETLRKACVHSKDSLQLSALRALAIQSITPVAGDLAAAAAALNSEDAAVRLEAARTYLLLVARSTTEFQ